MLVIIWGINISNNLILILSFVLPAIALTTLVLDCISNKKTNFLGGFFFLVSLAALLIKNVKIPFFQELNSKLLTSIPYSNWIILAITVLGVIFSGLFYLIHTQDTLRKQLVLKTAKIYEQTNVLAYISKKGGLIQLSKKLHELVYSRQKDLALKSVEVGEAKIGPKQVMKNIIKYNAKLNEALDYKFIFENNLEVVLRMVKKEILYNEKLIGYILLDPSVSSEYSESFNEIKRSFYIYLDLLDEPIAYFDEEENGYVASRNLMRSLQTEENIIPLDQFRHIMHKDDLAIFDSRQIEANKYQQVQYRLLTANGYAWFEEGAGNFFGKKYIIMKKIALEESDDLNFGTYKNYVARVEENIANNLNFSIALLNIHTLPSLIQEQGKDYANLVLNHFFAKINNGVLKDRVQIYKVANIEFALLIEGEEYYDLMVRSLVSNTADIMMQEIVINKNKTKVEAHVGLVSSKELPQLDAQKIMKAAFDTMKEASDPEFLKEYSIYQNKEVFKLDYSLVDLGIDLEADDLSAFVDELKK